MQEQQFDGQAMVERVGTLSRELEKSNAYPAVIGAVAGGIAGALIAAVIAGRISSSRSASEESFAAVKSELKDGSWNIRDLVQLATVAVGLVKQFQAWNQERRAAE